MLRVEGITQIFGGITALEDISFGVRPGSVTGVIGPNGAGKTTLFNIVTGLYTQTSGRVFLEGSDISGFPPERLAPRGLVRTFQNIEMFHQMTVLENVLVGLHSRSRCGILSCTLKLPWHLAEERRMRDEGLKWLEFCGIADLAPMEAGALPFGKCRLVEIARAMAVGPRLLLMDEPAAGLNSRETADLEGLIGKIRDSGVTVVLVEHDMELVMNICDAIVVLNLGKKLAEGTPREIQENPDVIRAYLGEG